MTNQPVHAETRIAPVISEVLGGDALTLAAAARTLPPHRGKCTSPRTLWRWHMKGVQTGERRVHLEMARVGTMWVTSRAALARFLTALTPALPQEAVALPPRTRPTNASRPRKAKAANWRPQEFDT